MILRKTMISLLLLLVLPSCRRVSTYISIKQFQYQTIYFPVSLVEINGYEGQKSKKDSSLATLVIWIDSTECSTCRIGHLNKYSNIWDFLSEKNSDMKIIISPKEYDYESVYDSIINRRFKFNVYLDPLNRFSTSNKVPRDKRFHSFLITTDGHPIFVGDPTNSDMLESTFKQSIERIRKQDQTW